MPKKDRSFHESPEKAGGESWLLTPVSKITAADDWGHHLGC